VDVRIAATPQRRRTVFIIAKTCSVRGGDIVTQSRQ